MWRGSPCFLVLLAGSSLQAPTSDANRFIERLDTFRRGDTSAREPLLHSVEAWGRLYGRDDPAEIAAFYLKLDAAALAEGVAFEDEFDLLRKRAATLETNDLAGTRALRQELRSYLLRAKGIRDLPVRAHALSLDARLGVRLLEQPHGMTQANESEATASVGREAALSLELFGRGGQVTPTLEPLWILARCALLRADLDTAEDRFTRLDEVADRVGQDTWRERALLGLIGIARERGSRFTAEGLLDELATFRAPKTCWSLAREVAVQKLFADDGEGTLTWLESFPPSELDGEIGADLGFALAREEWRSLKSAALMRLGRVDRARAVLGPKSEPGPIALLTRAAIHLEAGDPARALALARELRGRDTSAAGGAERLTLEGRAWLALGRYEKAIPPLEAALAAAGSRGDHGDARTAVLSGSRVGEWLGLSAVETLGRAYVASGSPLRAAGLFESVHAPELERLECEAAILDIAAGTGLGYVTWMVGADQTLAVYVAPGGSASAAPIAIGARGLERGILRLRDALAAPPCSGSETAWRALAMELGETLLPEALRAGLRRQLRPGATLVLAPHGVLERLPFEALITRGDPRPLGIRAGITVMTALRRNGDLAPVIDGQRANWVALGAPTTGVHDPLPGAGREIDRIGRLHPRWTVVTGEALTRSALEEALLGDRPLHLATHVARVPGDAGRTSVAPWGFVVSGDKLVSARDVLQLGPRLPLVTLTACGSAEGASVDGLSVRGLAQTMLASGTRAAVVTLWPIQDDAAERASVRLHAALLSGATPAEATRRAREFLWQLGAPPSEWAAYRALE